MPSLGRLFVVDQGSGPGVLLLHGQPGTNEHMSLIVSHLGRNVRTLSVDRPGYGRSEMPAEPFDVQADLLAQLITSRNAGPVVVVGHSYGGGVALFLAAQHPDLVKGLVLVASLGGKGSVTFGDWLLAAPFLGGIASALTLGAYEYFAPTLARFSRSGALAVNVPMVPTSVLSQQRTTFLAEQRFLMNARKELAEILDTVHCPATVMTGDRDLIIPREAAVDLAARLSNGRLVEIPGQGHLIPRDAPDAVAQEVLGLVATPV